MAVHGAKTSIKKLVRRFEDTTKKCDTCEQMPTGKQPMSCAKSMTTLSCPNSTPDGL